MQFPQMLVAIVGTMQIPRRRNQIDQSARERGQAGAGVRDNPEHGFGATLRTGSFYARRFEKFSNPRLLSTKKFKSGNVLVIYEPTPR
jgi:hypothetical protein